MKICAMLQIRDCGKKILFLLMAISRFVDDIVVLDHASKDDTHRIVKLCPKVREVLRENEPNWALVEMKNKQRLLEHSLLYKPDWLFWIDSDELPSSPLIEGVRSLPEKHPSVSLFGFPEVNLWNDEYHYRTDEGWYPAWTYRLIKVNGGLKFSQKRGVGPRNPMIPEGKTHREPLLVNNMPILHYGYMTEQQRQDKFKLYMSLDDNKDEMDKYFTYNRIVEDKIVVLKEVEPKWLLTPQT